MTSVLVTGASGFIGQNLLKGLQRENQKIYVLRRGDNPVESRSPVNSITLKQLSELNEEFETVYHCAGSGVNPNSRTPESLISGNITFSIDLMSALRSCKVQRFINLGSCSQYGSAENKELIDEEHSLDSKSLYGVTKTCSEKALQTIAADRGIDFIGFRIFGVYGPGEANQRLIPAIVQSLLAGRRVPLTSGTQIRDFLHVEDVIGALTSDPGPGIYNLCSAVGVPVREVAETVAVCLEEPLERLGFGELPDRPDEEKKIVGDNRKLTMNTGWSPKVSMSKGISSYATILSSIAP